MPPSETCRPRPISGGLDFLERAEALLHDCPDNCVERAKCLMDIAREVVVQDPARALELAKGAELLALQSNAIAQALHARVTQAFALTYLSQLSRARALLDALRPQLPPADRTLLARVAQVDAILRQRSGDIAGALTVAFQALRMLERQPEPDDVALYALLCQIGNLLTKMADHEGARLYHARALEIAERTGRRNSVVALLNNLGMVHRELAELEQAAELFHRALDLLGPDEVSHIRAVVLGNLGLVLVENGMAADALVPLRVALKLCHKQGIARGLGTMHHNLGLAGHMTGDFVDAALHYQQALDLRAAADESLELAETQLKFAELLLVMGSHEDALALADRVLAGPTAWHRLRAEAHLLAYRAEVARGRPGSALDRHVAYHHAHQAWEEERIGLRQQARALRGDALA